MEKPGRKDPGLGYSRQRHHYYMWPIIEKHPKTIGKNKVVVPQKFFKVVLSPFVKPMRAIGFLFNNEQAVEPLSSYTVTIDSIESLTNMNFFAPLPDEIENKIEADINYSLWPN
ncbi:DNA/RNA non-specific endonuclease [Bacteroides ovatus]|nr:DNA/RNA non-specific endonuclease [Bacteroides ovatus]